MAESDVLCEDDVRESHGVSEGHVCPEISSSWLGEGLHGPLGKQQGPGWGRVVVNGHDARVRKEILLTECLHRTLPGGAHCALASRRYSSSTGTRAAGPFAFSLPGPRKRGFVQTRTQQKKTWTQI